MSHNRLTREEWEQSIRERQEYLTPDQSRRAFWVWSRFANFRRPIRTPGQLFVTALGFALLVLGSIPTAIAIGAGSNSEFEWLTASPLRAVFLILGGGSMLFGAIVIYRTFFR